MNIDSAGNLMAALSSCCGWCCGPVDTSGKCQNRCDAAAVVSNLERRLRFLTTVDADAASGWCGEHERRFAAGAREGSDGKYDECQVCRAEQAEARLAETETRLIDREEETDALIIAAEERADAAVAKLAAVVAAGDAVVDWWGGERRFTGWKHLENLANAIRDLEGK